MTQLLRLAFMATPDFALPALASLRAAGHEIAAVYTQPPRPAERGQKERPSAVARAAGEQGLEVRHPTWLRDPGEIAAFHALALDAAVVVAYGLILPAPFLDAPRLGCLNIHGSLLPRWRGAAPIQRAILAGDRETGVTIMRMDEGLDTGPMLLRRAVPIGRDDNAGALHDRLAALGAAMIVEALDGLAAGRLPALPQPDTGVCYALKIQRAETRLDWVQPAALLERQVRAFSPAPGAWFDWEGKRVRVLRAECRPGEIKGPVGTMLPDLTVRCGDGKILALLELQRAGGRAMGAVEFANGLRLAAPVHLA
ncbi:MAG: methionyl-tRNA formyltransferase [Dongiaceae bacterium]